MRAPLPGDPFRDLAEGTFKPIHPKRRSTNCFTVFACSSQMYFAMARESLGVQCAEDYPRVYDQLSEVVLPHHPVFPLLSLLQSGELFEAAQDEDRTRMYEIFEEVWDVMTLLFVDSLASYVAPILGDNHDLQGDVRDLRIALAERTGDQLLEAFGLEISHQPGPEEGEGCST